MLILAHDDIRAIAKDWINRHEEELSERKGNKSTRIFTMEAMRAKELNEFENGNGMEVPDLTRATVVKAIRLWNGDFNGISLIATTMLTAA
jgi:hypothetical protein